MTNLVAKHKTTKRNWTNALLFYDMDYIQYGTAPNGLCLHVPSATYLHYGARKACVIPSWMHSHNQGTHHKETVKEVYNVYIIIEMRNQRTLCGLHLGMHL